MAGGKIVVGAGRDRKRGGGGGGGRNDDPPFTIGLLGRAHLGGGRAGFSSGIGGQQANATIRKKGRCRRTFHIELT